MEKQTKHPHQTNPSDEEIRQVLNQVGDSADAAVIDMYITLHQVVINTLPGINSSMDLKDGKMGYGIKQYGYDGWGMAALAHHKKRVNLHFMQGVQLLPFDETGILEGAGKKLRHIKFSSVNDVKKMEKPLKQLLERASTLTERKRWHENNR